MAGATEGEDVGEDVYENSAHEGGAVTKEETV